MQLAEADAVFALGDDRDIKGRKGLPLHRRANDADRFVFVPVIYLEKAAHRESAGSGGYTACPQVL